AHHSRFLSGFSAGPECGRRAGLAEGKPALGQVGAHLREYVAKHLGRQHAGVRVVTRAMIAVIKPKPPGLANGAVPKWRGYGAKPKCLHGGFVGDAAECDDG